MIIDAMLMPLFIFAATPPFAAPAYIFVTLSPPAEFSFHFFAISRLSRHRATPTFSPASSAFAFLHSSTLLPPSPRFFADFRRLRLPFLSLSAFSFIFRFL
jgi:hypothetical protein